MNSFNPELSASDRLNLISRLVAQDEVAVSLLEKLLASAENFFGKVVDMEARTITARLALDGTPLRELTEALEKNRALAHEALIADLRIFNRYLAKNHEDAPVGGIFSKEPAVMDDPAAVADWAGELLLSIYQERRR